LKSQFQTALGFGIFVIVFLLAFKPFELDSLPGSRLLLACGMYGLATFISIISGAFILTRVFPSFFIEENWTTGRQIIYIGCNVLLTGLVNYLVSPLFVSTNYSFESFLWFEGSTILVALLPITFHTLIRQNSLLKKFEQQAAALEKKLQEKLDAGKEKEAPLSVPEKKNESPVIELTGDYQGEKLVLPPQDIYFIAAANNYVKVYFDKNGKVAYSILRMTMKKAEEALQAWPDFFRCHRAYIINLDKVEHVEGNAQGYKIILTHTDELIPVSRNLNTEFSDKLLATRNNIAL
jgi:DNA-binding LytR/AlgR family response regulator